MECGVETDINFYYNATLDAFASPPTGMTYSQFLHRNKHRILHSNKHPALVVVTGPPQFVDTLFRKRLFN
jgi:hypothetical protein